MTIQSREYQDKIIADTRAELLKHNRVIIQLMVGGGKTALAAMMLGGAAKKGVRSFFNVHRQELIDQTAETFDKVGIKYGIIAAGYAPNPYEPIQICSIQTLANRLDKVQKPKLIIEDECHHSVSKSRKKILDSFPDARIVGLTATPERLDGRGLGEIYQSMVKGPDAEWLIENGYLSDYKLFEPPSVDMSKVKTVKGDYDKEESVKLINNKSITGSAINEYIRLGREKSAVVFAINIQHSKQICADFIAAGVKAAHLDGETPRAERKSTVAAFKRGDIKVLCNVDLFGEGFNLPDLDIVILLRPTQSLGLYIQQCGRALRYSPKKKFAYILDHVGNKSRHGMPSSPFEWSLNAKKRGKKKASEVFPSKTCPKCYYSHKPAPQCPECGHKYEVKASKIEIVEGSLIEADRKKIFIEKKKQQGQAQTYEELVALGKERGYANPKGWAYNILRTRKRR